MSLVVTSTSLEFEPIREIGFHGKNSKVYLAHDKQLDSDIVVKRIEKSKISDLTKLFEEARRLNDSYHPHGVPLKFASYDTDHIYLGMPYYRKGSLKDLIDARFLTVREIVRYSIQFLTGLNNIHVKNLIHFDIKPDNILLSDTDEALVSDFGVANSMDFFGLSEIDQAYYKHIPPEYFISTKHSMLFDIYSAGLTIYRLCNGNKSFYDQFNSYPDRNNMRVAIVSGQFPKRDQYLYHIPKRLKKIIKKSLSIKPEDRFQTVLEFLNSLSQVDELLDWKYSEGTHTQSWSKEDDDRIILVELVKLPSFDYKLTASKTIKSSGNVTNVSHGCSNKIDPKDVEDCVTTLLLSFE